MLVTLILTTYQRDHLLKHTLPTITRQNIPGLEVIIVNDGTPDNTEAIAKQHGCKYIFTGQRNLKHKHWRIPGFAFNIGVQQAKGEIIMLSCAEIFHLGNVITRLLLPVAQDPMALAIPYGKDDDGTYLKALRNIEETPNIPDHMYHRLPNLNTRLPFLMAMSKALFLNIGGYDEDFIGQAFDDNDITDRLLAYGCHYVQTDAQCVHLYHARSGPGRSRKLHEYNRRLYEARRGVIVRNVGKDWGQNVQTT